MDRRDHRIRKGRERAAMAGVDGIGVPSGDAKRHARAGPVDEDRTESFAITLAEIGKGVAGWRIFRHRDVRSCSCRRRSEEHTSELQSLMRISYAVFCLKKKKH